MRRVGQFLYDCCLRPAARGLIAFGSYWVHVPPVERDLDPNLFLDGEQLTGPAAGHPERLRPDVPLSPLERELSRSLGIPPRRTTRRPATGRRP